MSSLTVHRLTFDWSTCAGSIPARGAAEALLRRKEGA
jgi:hypothetical protein